MVYLCSALTLLVAGVLAKHAYDALAAYYLALVTNLFDAGANLHGGPSVASRESSRPGSLLGAR